MTPDQLRALAEALDKITPVMGLEELHHMATLDRAADFLRQCAEQRPVAWKNTDLDGMVEAFHRVIESHADKYSPFHQPVNADAIRALRILRGLLPAMKAMLAAAPVPPKREPLSDGQLASVCLSYRHDFGLLNKDEQARLMLEARDWERAFRKEWQREPLSDEQIAKGDYVLATKWGDGDPGDHWGVGFYDRLHNGRHYVLDNGGKQIRGNGFRRVGRITPEMGRWLLSAAAMLESSPPGTVNLWTMLTGGSDDK